MIEVKPGIVLMVIGLSGMVFGLANQGLAFVEKLVIVIVCFVVMALGVVIENPFVQEWIEQPTLEEDYS